MGEGFDLFRLSLSYGGVGASLLLLDGGEVNQYKLSLREERLAATIAVVLGLLAADKRARLAERRRVRLQIAVCLAVTVMGCAIVAAVVLLAK